MHEYKCKKCKKSFKHFLELHHSCDCGGELKEIHTFTRCYPDLNFTPPITSRPTEFIPVRYFGGHGDIWYYRKKRSGKLKL